MKLLAGVAGGAGALGLLVRWGHRAVLYPAPRRKLLRPPSGCELVETRASDGEPLQLLWAPPRAGARTVVFFHGNGETIGDVVSLFREIGQRGIGFVLVEYRGYGGSPASAPSEAGLYADAEGALSFARERGHTQNDIALWGFSLGSGVATEMATRGHGKRLLLTAPYTSIPDVAQRYAPFLPMRTLIADQFDNLAKADRLRLPTLILHGDDDRIVPYDMGVTLANRIAGAELVTVRGAGHNDVFAHDSATLLDRVTRFIAS
jgi:fermentation-respiration switch protein FrsA (DUF1100 family)